MQKTTDEVTTAAQPTSSARKQLYLAGTFIDSLGSGLWMPFLLIFLVRAQHLPIAQVGLALTVGGVVGLVFGPLAGTLVDRGSAATTLLLSNLIRALAFCLYPQVGAVWQVAVLAAATAAADRMFWTSNAPLLGWLASGRALDRILGVQSVIRIVGLGVGAAAAAPLAGSVGGLHLIAYLNAATFVVAAAILYPVARALEAGRPGRSGPPDGEAGAAPAKATWSDVLRDRPYVLLCAVQLVLALAASSFVLILPLVALDPLGGPTWLPAASIVVGNVVLAVVQAPAVRLAERASRVRVISLSGVVFAVAFLVMLPGPYVNRLLVTVVVLASSVIGVVAEALFAPLMTAAANQAAPEELKGRYSALFQTSWGAANVLTPVVCTVLLAVGYQALWLGLAGLALATIPLLAYAAARLPATALRT
jgi:MFS family permease